MDHAKRLKESERKNTEAVKLKPDSAFAPYCRRSARTKLGGGRGAIVDVEQALKKGAGSAVQDFFATIESNPADPDWYIARARSLLSGIRSGRRKILRWL